MTCWASLKSEVRESISIHAIIFSINMIVSLTTIIICFVNLPLLGYNVVSLILTIIIVVIYTIIIFIVFWDSVYKNQKQSYGCHFIYYVCNLMPCVFFALAIIANQTMPMSLRIIYHLNLSVGVITIAVFVSMFVGYIILSCIESFKDINKQVHEKEMTICQVLNNLVYKKN